MSDETYNAVKRDFITALRIIYREGLSDAFAHLSARSNDGNEMLFMPRKSPALVQRDELFFVDFDKAVPQSSLHQAIYKARADVKAVFHFHSPAVVLLSVVGQSIREVCMLGLFLEESARLQSEAMQIGTPIFMERDEAEKIAKRTFKPTSTERAWDHCAAKRAE